MGPNWQTAKGLIRNGLAEMLYLSSFRRVCHKGKVAILTYHRVVPEDELADHWIQPGMYVVTDVFERHMEFLRDQCHVISMLELVERWRHSDWDQEARYCAVTFDDGWLDNYRYAYPILRKFQIPATVFLPTDFIGTYEWFWPEKVAYCVRAITGNEEARGKGAVILKKYIDVQEQATRSACGSEDAGRILADQVIERCKDFGQETISELLETVYGELAISLPRERCIVNWDEVVQMAEGDISFGSHSRSHRILTQLALEDVREELEGSQQVLKSRVGSYVPVFCYPNGNTNAQIEALAKNCGYSAAVGVRPGLEGRHPASLFDLRRIGIHNDVAATVPLYSMRLCAPSIL
jgi:peptidoglycan/xylan/chitin deacetylase (PgdA/CDA1 family)